MAALLPVKNIPSIVAISMASFLSAVAAEAPDPLEILQENCVRCHTPAKRKGDLLMDSRESLVKGGDTGAAIVSGKSGESYLIETLFPDHDSHMPPKGQLEPPEIAALEEWIDAGAPWDEAKWKLLNEPKIADVKLSAIPTNYLPVLALALSPDGKWLAAGRANAVDVYEIVPNEDPKKIPTFELRKSLTGHLDLVQSLAFSNDGKRLASGGFRKMILWKSADWSQEKIVENKDPFRGRITALAFSKDGKSVIAADSLPAQVGKIHSVDVASGKVKTVVDSAHDDSIFDLEFNPDGSQFASASADKLVIIRNAKTFKPTITLEGHTGYVIATAFGPEGKRIATAGDDEAIKVWEVKTGKQVSSFSTKSSGPVNGLAWTIDPSKTKSKADEKDEKKKEAINTDRIVAINQLGKPGTFTDLVEHEGEQRSTGAREKAHISAEEPLTVMAYDKSSLMLFSGTESGRIFIWDKDGKRVQQLEPPMMEVANKNKEEEKK